MSARVDPDQLEELQARLLERLQAAGGAPVSFQELREIGIENPALLCYELAAVGLPVTRTCSPAEGMPALSVRLESKAEEPPAAREEQPGRAEEQTGGSEERPGGAEQQPAAAEANDARPERRRAVARPRSPSRRLEGAIALVLAVAGFARSVTRRLAGRVARARAERHPHPPRLMAFSALALVAALTIAIAMSSDHRAARPGTRERPHGSSRTAAVAAGRAGAPRAPTPAAPKPAPPAVQAAGARAVGAQVSPARAAALQSVGHRLLGEGSYSSAIGKLLDAIRSSGQSLAGCMEPASEACLTFAYALYDLGRALRLQGRHTEAMAILSRRLQIDNQRSVVQRELELARGASS